MLFPGKQAKINRNTAGNFLGNTLFKWRTYFLRNTGSSVSLSLPRCWPRPRGLSGAKSLPWGLHLGSRGSRRGWGSQGGAHSTRRELQIPGLLSFQNTENGSSLPPCRSHTCPQSHQCSPWCEEGAQKTPSAEKAVTHTQQNLPAPSSWGRYIHCEALCQLSFPAPEAGRPGRYTEAEAKHLTPSRINIPTDLTRSLTDGPLVIPFLVS